MSLRFSLLVLAILTAPLIAAEPEPLLPKELSYFGSSIYDYSSSPVICYKDGVLVESDLTHSVRVSFARFDSNQTAPVKVTGLDTVVEFAQTPDGVVFLGVTDGKLILVKKSATGEQKVIPTPAGWELTTPSLRILASTQQVAARAGNTIWWYDGAWHHRELPTLPKGLEKLDGYPIGQTNYLKGSVLYSGWHFGEFGGLLAFLDLSSEKETWVLLGRKTAKDEGVPKDAPVSSLVFSKEGDLWIGAGLAHLGMRWGGLYHRNTQGNWETLINSNSEKNLGRFSFSEGSEITNLTFDSKGALYILAAQSGIYRLSDGKLTKVISDNFQSHRSSPGDNSDSLYPAQLAVTDQGTLFVSTNSFGLLAFAMRDGKWVGKQIGLAPEKPAAPTK